MLRGAAPGWASPAHPPRLRYALGARGQVAGFLFSYPLTAGRSASRSDKILWIVASPRGGLPLRITAHPLGATSPAVSSTWPADSSPGEIYPSGIAVPSPGCWRFSLSWKGHADTVDLWFARKR